MRKEKIVQDILAAAGNMENNKIKEIVLKGVEDIQVAESSGEITEIMTGLVVKLISIFSLINGEDLIKLLNANKLAHEVLTVKEDLEKDYQENIKTLRYFNLIIEDPEKPGRFYYQADYDGTTEASGKGEDFAGRIYEMPTINEIMSSLIPHHVRLYRKMQQQKMKPMFQLIPIGMELRSLGMAIDQHKFSRRQLDVYIMDQLERGQLDESQLIYEPLGLKTSEDQKKLILSGGKSKTVWIKEHEGWQIKIVSMQPELEENPAIIYPNPQLVNHPHSFATQVELHLQAMQKNGFTGLSYEGYLIAQMQALRKGKPLDIQSSTVLTDSCFNRSDFIPYGRFNNDQVCLIYEYADRQGRLLRVRPSVLIKRGR